MSPRGGPPRVWDLVPLSASLGGNTCEASVLGRQCKTPARGGLDVDGEEVALCWQHARILARDHWLGLHRLRALGEVQSLTGIPGAVHLSRQLRMEPPL